MACGILSRFSRELPNTPFFLAPTLLTAAALPLAAQSSPPADGGSTKVLQSIFVPPLPDAPFTLTPATEWVRRRAGRQHRDRDNERRIVRNRAGRIYKERVLLLPPGARIAEPDQLAATDGPQHAQLA